MTDAPCVSGRGSGQAAGREEHGMDEGPGSGELSGGSRHEVST